MGSPWKAVSDDSRREILMLLKDGEKTPGEIAGHFRFTLPALSAHLKVLREADLVSEKKEGQKRYYSLNKDQVSEMMQFFDALWDYRLQSLKEYVENKEKKEENEQQRN
jgi:ArsR family transcriptional regulator, arsenate/arsenite/antimonite-responsive transcriptional repressor